MTTHRRWSIGRYHAPDPQTRSDVFAAGSADPAATALYDYWDYTRRIGVVPAASLCHVALVARDHTGDLREFVGAEHLDDRYRYHMPAVIDDLRQLGHSCESLTRAWHVAATAEPPVWADECARMPVLDHIRRALHCASGFPQTSSLAQLLLLSIAGEIGDPAPRSLLLDKDVLSCRVHASVDDAWRGVQELETRAWLRLTPFYDGELEPSVAEVSHQVFRAA